MRIVKKIPIDRILSKIYNDFGFEDIEESTVVEWTGDVLSQLDVFKSYEERVAFIEVKNHQAKLPNDIISILRIARNNRYSKDSCTSTSCIKECLCDKKEKVEEPTQEMVMWRDCTGRLILPHGVEAVYYTPDFKVDHLFWSWIDSDLYTSSFSYIKPADDAFKSAIVCEQFKEGKDRLYNPTNDEYSIVGDSIRVSFKEGQIALAYLAQPLDINTGYPLIPDDISVINAITNYILFMYCRKMDIIGRDGYKERYKTAEEDYQWYLSQAKNKLYAPYGVDEFQKITEQRYSFLPNVGKFSYKNPRVNRK